VHGTSALALSSRKPCALNAHHGGGARRGGAAREEEMAWYGAHLFVRCNAITPTRLLYAQRARYWTCAPFCCALPRVRAFTTFSMNITRLLGIIISAKTDIAG
jgi:hypothetical protein